MQKWSINDQCLNVFKFIYSPIHLSTFNVIFGVTENNKYYAENTYCKTLIVHLTFIS